MTDTALLIIDLQKGLFNRKASVYRAEDLLAKICTLIDRAHRAGAPVFFVQQTTKNLLAKGSDNWKLHPALQPHKDDMFINKRYASAFKETDLKMKLGVRKVKRVIVMGIATHQCVRATCIHARQLGFDVTLVKDGHSSFNRNAAQLIDEWNKKLSMETATITPAKEIDFT